MTGFSPGAESEAQVLVAGKPAETSGDKESA